MFSESSRKAVGVQEYRETFGRKEAHALIGPNNVILQVNYGCYLECQMCDRHKWVEQGAPVDEVLTTGELANLFAEFAEMNTRKITLVGTEPVMRPGLLRLLAEIRGHGMKPELYTAGVLLKDEVIRAILDYSVDTAFSVDGFYPQSHNRIRMPSKNIDVFGRTLSSISRLQEARNAMGLTMKNTLITANFTIQRGNIEDLKTAGPEQIDALGVDVLRLSIVHGEGPYSLDSSDMQTVADFARRLKGFQTTTEVDLSSGVKNVVTSVISPADFDNGVLVPSETLTGERKIRCHIGEFSAMIDPKGNVRPCLYLYDDNGPYAESDRDKFVLGNIRQKSFKDIWQGDNYANFRRAYEFPHLEAGSRCRTCEYTDHFEELDQALATEDPSGWVMIGW